MNIDVNTFLTTVYCIVDDLYKAHWAPVKPVRPGKRPELSDSEVLTLAILAQWQQNRSERAFLRYAIQHWRGYFPHLLTQSAFNRRARGVCGVLMQLGPAISQQLTESLGDTPAYEVMDGVAVPLMRRCRGNRHRVFANEAGIGRGGSDKTWYYGVQLLATVNPKGLVTGFVVGPANTEERWLAEALFRWRWNPNLEPPTAEELGPVLGPTHRPHGRRIGPTGPIASWLSVGTSSAQPDVADLGFQGAAWIRHWWRHYGARVLTEADYSVEGDAATWRKARHWLSSLRQVVETVFACLTERLGLEFPRARSYWGLLTRLAAKIAAHNIAVHINLCCDQPPFAALDPLT